MNLTLLGAFLYLACGAAVFLLGLLVLREGPADRLRRVAAAMMFFGGFGPFLGGLRMLVERGGGAAFAATDLAATFAQVWEFFFPSLLFFALVFPYERPVVTRFRHFAFFLYFPYLFHLVLLLFLGRLGAPLARFELSPPFGLGGSIATVFAVAGGMIGLTLRLLARFHVRFFSLVDLVYIAAAIALLRGSLRGLPSPKLRRQLRVVLLGLGSCVGLYAVAVPLPTLFSAAAPPALRMVFLTAALVVGTGAIGFAIVRTSFLDVGTVLRRAILFSGTIGAMGITFLLLARQMDRMLQARIAQEIPLFQGLFAVLAVIFFHPLLGRIEGTVDRVLAGERVAHREVMRRLGREMTAILDLSRLAARIEHALAEALAAARVTLVLLEQSGERYTEIVPEEEGEAMSLGRDHPLLSALAGAYEPLAARDVADETARPEDRREVRRLLARRETRIVVPIHLPDEEELFGFIALGPKVTGGRYLGEEVGLLSILSTQIGFAARNARLHEEAVRRRVVDEELALARTVQESIVPKRSGGVSGLDVAALNLPSHQMGGDYYDLIAMPGGQLGVAVGDVSGKGIPAALLMSMLHAALHVQMNGVPEVAPLMGRLNRILCRSTSPEKFATFFFGVYDPARGVFRFANGGHNFPVLLRPNGSATALEKGGLILGFDEGAVYEEESIAVGGGDLVVFYTDGVTEEARGDEQFGEARLIDVVRRSRAERSETIVEAVRGAVAAFAGRERFDDDFTLIVLRARGGEEA